MFKVMIQVGKSWVEATQEMPRSQARRIAKTYRSGRVSPYVTAARVVRTESK